jgi:methionyl-tRNA formyltransferase
MVSVVVLGLNRFGEKVYEYLLSHEETDVLALLTDDSQYKSIEKLNPDILISAGFDHIIPEETLSVPEQGAINLHPSFLPYNKGVNPDVWSIIRDEPAGVSIHYMSPEMDQGPIIAREKVPIEPNDTGRSLRKKLDNAIVRLFRQEWESICQNTCDPVPQSDEGTVNYSNELARECELKLNHQSSIGDLIDKLRALSFPPYHNAYFETDGKKYYVRISITPEDQAIVDDNEWDTPTLF